MSDVNNRQPAEVQELSEILQVRRDKLTALQSEGLDPFVQTKYDVNCDSATIKNNFYRMSSISKCCSCITVMSCVFSC